MIVEARVTKTNKGGLEVEVNGIRGFMPIGQITLTRIEDASMFVGQKLHRDRHRGEHAREKPRRLRAN